MRLKFFDHTGVTGVARPSSPAQDSEPGAIWLNRRFEQQLESRRQQLVQRRRRSPEPRRRSNMRDPHLFGGMAPYAIISDNL